MNARWRTPAGLHTASVRLPVEGELPGFEGATGWLNSPPLTPAGLRGKVVLVDFWTYTCINWLRQLPYVRAWAAKYADHGLVVIGVHTPEFAFEHHLDNVRQAVQDLGIAYPVALDSDYAVWRAFDNHYWPALYFADAGGTHPPSSLRRRRIRSSQRWSSSSCWPRPEPATSAGTGIGRRPRCRSARRLGHPEIAGKLHRL